MSDSIKSLEVELNQEGGKAVVAGKTSVPFKTFVSLILQRKIQALFKQCQNEPVIVGSELLTRLASAPDDKMEDRAKLVLITLGVGILFGIFLSAITMLILALFDMQFSIRELAIIAGSLFGLALLVTILGRLQLSVAKQKIYEKMEWVSEVLSR